MERSTGSKTGRLLLFGGFLERLVSNESIVKNNQDLFFFYVINFHKHILWQTKGQYKCRKDIYNVQKFCFKIYCIDWERGSRIVEWINDLQVDHKKT